MMDAESKIPDTDYLWRYMDLDKFVNMVAFKDLYFQSTSGFEDPFENYCDIVKAVISGENVESLYAYYIDKEPELAQDLTSEADKRKWLANLFCLVQDATTISCWHHNNNQSEAMWKLYTTNVKSAVAIRTTFGKIQKIFTKEQGFQIREIEYIDYVDYVPNVYDAKWYKRKIFKHEQEVRIARIETHYGQQAYNRDGSVARSSGIAHHIPFNFNELVDKIYISPYAARQFADTVAAIKAQYALECPIIFQDREYPADTHWEKPRTIMERYRKG